jgi:hypothetical protein
MKSGSVFYENLTWKTVQMMMTTMNRAMTMMMEVVSSKRKIRKLQMIRSSLTTIFSTVR